MKGIQNKILLRNGVTLLVVAISFIVLCSLTFRRDVWTQASFPGGYDALEKFIRDSVRYPANERAAKIEALVGVQFEVSEEGRAMNPVVTTEYGTGSSGFSEEVTRLLNTMPLWKPGTKNGSPVVDKWNYINVKFELPDSLFDVGPSADTMVYTEVDSVALFPGGEIRMMQFLQYHIRYPQREKEEGVMGTVYVSFIVEKSGRVSNVRIEKGVADGPGLNKESVRVVSLFERHKPAMKNGQKVRYRKTIPVRYELR